MQEIESTLSLESTIAPRPDLIYLLREEDEKLVLLFGATQISFPGFVREALVSALERGPFVVRDLPQLDDEGKLVLVRRLLREGLLMRQNGSLRRLADMPTRACLPRSASYDAAP